MLTGSSHSAMPKKVDAWRWDYNENRPHRSLKGLTPSEFAGRVGNVVVQF